jgi:hypothetical protein
MKNSHGVERADIRLGTKAKIAGTQYFYEIVSVNGDFLTVAIDAVNRRQVRFGDIEMLYTGPNRATGKEQRFEDV